VYTVQSTSSLGGARRALLRGRLRERVGGTVLLLGTCSLLTDISSEMVSAVLPLYLVYTLGLTPLQFGLIDGLYQGAGALVRVAAGFVGDRTRRHKEVAATGYGLSAVCKLLFIAVGSVWPMIAATITLDRTGKGIRTAPRDAMISLSTPKEQLGTAFGVHRALDTTGAMIGPLLAFGMLALAPEAFHSLFLVSFLIALVGFAILTLFVRNPQAPDAAASTGVPERKVSLRAALGLVGGRRFRTLLLVGSGLGLATMSDGFVYLGLQRRLDFETRMLPLLYVGTALVYMVLAVPFGKLADRVGRGKVFVAGYGLLLLVYASLLLPAAGVVQLVACLLVFGGYYAATDGVLMAAGSALLPAELRGSGLSLLTTGTSVSRLLGSVIFGALWTAFGLQLAVAAFAVALALAAAASAVVLAHSRVEPAGA
jgi:MFS family permease